MAEAQLFVENKRKFDELSKVNESEEIELSLGLSLNGRFGVDPNRLDNNPIVRSTSVSNFGFAGAFREVETVRTERVGLGRTASLPVATEEEWRRRKEAQSMRRMEAKRKRVEKMMSEKMKIGGLRSAKDRVVSGEGAELMGSSSGASESEPRATNEGSNIPLETRSPGQNVGKQIVPTGEANTNTGTKATNTEAAKERMENMPCVWTRGVGPNGKRVDGFLYGYRKGEEVKILCVCHGIFLSPAEFVKHAGGAGDVSQPLKHIVINPSPHV